jgi:hypothetical protein
MPVENTVECEHRRLFIGTLIPTTATNASDEAGNVR